MEKSYKMVKQNAEAVLIEKKSRFIGYSSPVFSEEEALQFINSIRKKHYDASHNCYAYILGEGSATQRSSDDGEPSGTAGVPILEVIRKESLTNTAVVVTRYFGGIMLGAGGLIRAYTEAAARSIHEAGMLMVKPFAVFSISADYSYLSKLQHELAKKDYIISDTEYTDTVTLKILTPHDQLELMPELAAEWTNGSAAVVYEGIRMLRLDLASNRIVP